MIITIPAAKRGRVLGEVRERVLVMYCAQCTLDLVPYSAASEEIALETAAKKFNISKDKIILTQGDICSSVLTDVCS